VDGPRAYAQVEHTVSPEGVVQENGMMTEGTPAPSPAAVVPAPPWWTNAAMRGKSQSWGVDSTLKTWSGKSDWAMPPQPMSGNPRCPESYRALGPRSAVFSGLRATMDWTSPWEPSTGSEMIMVIS
jgi:hypothetical protein